MYRYEVFDARDGVPIYRVPFAWIARLICQRSNEDCCRTRVLDWAAAGEGW